MISCTVFWTRGAVNVTAPFPTSVRQVVGPCLQPPQGFLAAQPAAQVPRLRLCTRSAALVGSALDGSAAATAAVKAKEWSGERNLCRFASAVVGLHACVMHCQQAKRPSWYDSSCAWQSQSQTIQT